MPTPIGWARSDMTLEQTKSQTPSLLLPYAEAVHQAMILAGSDEGGVNLAEDEVDLIPPKTGDGKESINPLNDQRRESNAQITTLRTAAAGSGDVHSLRASGEAGTQFIPVEALVNIFNYLFKRKVFDLSVYWPTAAEWFAFTFTMPQD